MLRHGTVVDLVRGPSGAVRCVALANGEIIEGDAVVIAMGPWSILAARWPPLPAVLGYKGHSLVFETGGAIRPEALFLEYREASGEILTPNFIPAGQWHHVGMCDLDHRAAAGRSCRRCSDRDPAGQPRSPAQTVRGVSSSAA